MRKDTQSPRDSPTKPGWRPQTSDHSRVKKAAHPSPGLLKCLNFEKKELHGHIQWKRLVTYGQKNTDWVCASCSRTIPRQKRSQNKCSGILAREPEPRARQTARQIPDMAMATELGTQEDNLHHNLNRKV